MIAHGIVGALAQATRLMLRRPELDRQRALDALVEYATGGVIALAEREQSHEP